MQYENIQKAIYARPEISKRRRPMWWALICTAVGAACAALMVALPDLSDGASSALLGVAIVGATCLLIWLFYQLIGDCQFPYHKPTHRLLQPTLQYYAQSSQSAIENALATGDEQALDRIKRIQQPELLLLRYSDEAETLYYSQLLRYEGKKMVAVSQIYFNQTKNN